MYKQCQIYQIPARPPLAPSFTRRRRPECVVQESMALVLMLSRAAGVAPVTLSREGRRWRVSYSRRMKVYGWVVVPALGEQRLFKTPMDKVYCDVPCRFVCIILYADSSNTDRSGVSIHRLDITCQKTKLSEYIPSDKSAQPMINFSHLYQPLPLLGRLSRDNFKFFCLHN